MVLLPAGHQMVLLSVLSWLRPNVMVSTSQLSPKRPRKHAAYFWTKERLNYLSCENTKTFLTWGVQRRTRTECFSELILIKPPQSPELCLLALNIDYELFFLDVELSVTDNRVKKTKPNPYFWLTQHFFYWLYYKFELWYFTVDELQAKQNFLKI